MKKTMVVKFGKGLETGLVVTDEDGYVSAAGSSVAVRSGFNGWIKKFKRVHSAEYVKSAEFIVVEHEDHETIFFTPDDGFLRDPKKSAGFFLFDTERLKKGRKLNI